MPAKAGIQQGRDRAWIPALLGNDTPIEFNPFERVPI
jgi:hypothetical protein